MQKLTFSFCLISDLSGSGEGDAAAVFSQPSSSAEYRCALQYPAGLWALPGRRSGAPTALGARGEWRRQARWYGRRRRGKRKGGWERCGRSGRETLQPCCGDHTRGAVPDGGRFRTGRCGEAREKPWAVRTPGVPPAAAAVCGTRAHETLPCHALWPPAREPPPGALSAREPVEPGSHGTKQQRCIWTFLCHGFCLPCPAHHQQLLSGQTQERCAGTRFAPRPVPPSTWAPHCHSVPQVWRIPDRDTDLRDAASTESIRGMSRAKGEGILQLWFAPATPAIPLLQRSSTARHVAAQSQPFWAHPDGGRPGVFAMSALGPPRGSVQFVEPCRRDNAAPHRPAELAGPEANSYDDQVRRAFFGHGLRRESGGLVVLSVSGLRYDRISEQSDQDPAAATGCAYLIASDPAHEAGTCRHECCTDVWFYSNKPYCLTLWWICLGLFTFNTMQRVRTNRLQDEKWQSEVIFNSTDNGTFIELLL